VVDNAFTIFLVCKRTRTVQILFKAAVCIDLKNCPASKNEASTYTAHSTTVAWSCFFRIISTLYLQLIQTLN
jgi:hypothetical protein